MKASYKAWLVTLGFSLIGIVSLIFFAPRSEFVIPHTLFYAVLTLNSFFSVRLFSAIQPKTISQTAADAILVLVYCGLALSIGDPIPFAFFALCVFVAAPPKYALMLGVIPHNSLLKRKILIDLVGTALCTAILGGALFGYELESAWTLAVVFTLANIYLLFIRPMYRLE